MKKLSINSDLWDIYHTHTKFCHYVSYNIISCYKIIFCLIKMLVEVSDYHLPYTLTDRKDFEKHFISRIFFFQNKKTSIRSDLIEPLFIVQ